MPQVLNLKPEEVDIERETLKIHCKRGRMRAKRNSSMLTLLLKQGLELSARTLTRVLSRKWRREKQPVRSHKLKLN